MPPPGVVLDVGPQHVLGVTNLADRVDVVHLAVGRALPPTLPVMGELTALDLDHDESGPEQHVDLGVLAVVGRGRCAKQI